MGTVFLCPHELPPFNCPMHILGGSPMNGFCENDKTELNFAIIFSTNGTSTAFYKNLSAAAGHGMG